MLSVNCCVYGFIDVGDFLVCEMATMLSVNCRVYDSFVGELVFNAVGEFSCLLDGYHVVGDFLVC